MSELDARVRPGLTPSKFYQTFTRCLCKMIMTRSAFPYHYCRHTIIDLAIDQTPTPAGRGEIFDLTLDDDESVIRVFDLT